MEPNRHALPIADIRRREPAAFDARDASAVHPPVQMVNAPKGAPNVLLVLLDDVGFGAASVFGGPCATPTAERLAANGLKYRRFHTTALCSPTRAALLTGRNHHSVGMGAVADLATSAPGYNSKRPNDTATLAETLRLNGYSTAQFGKCHEVPTWESSPVGPFDRWPTGSGFEYFYGFVAGEANQYSPALYENTTAIEPPEGRYHLTEDLTERAIDWIRQQKSLAPDRPFFCYFAPGATHAPHQIWPEWAERYRGRFDAGWDVLREETFARQKELGVVSVDAQLTQRPEEIPAWDDMPEALKPVLARQMEIYAGFLEHTDVHVGHIVDAISQMGLLEDTLVLYLVGDNGASAEGQPNGTFNELFTFNGMADVETPEFLISKMDELGGPNAFNHYSVGWAHAMDTPYQWTKQVASHWGGTRNGLIVHWPSHISAKGEVRDQFHHVIDIAPTILELANIPQPAVVHGVAQRPIEGTSMVYSLNDAAAPERHVTQYFECMGNRGIYHEGWTACTKHRTPWLAGGMVPFDDDVWELYAPDDWSQAHDLSSEMPDKLHELQRLWLIEAARHQVLPLDDRSVERFLAVLAGRPTLVQGDRQVLFGKMRRLSEHSVLNLKNRSHSITAEVVVPENPHGVLIAQGGSFGGWSLYLNEGRLTYCHNLLGLTSFFVGADTTLSAGTHQVRAEFAADGPGLAVAGTMTLYVDGTEVATGRIERTVPLLYSADESCDVGCDLGTPVSKDYTSATSEFNGEIHWVELSAEPLSERHVVDPDEWVRVIMARQ